MKDFATFPNLAVAGLDPAIHVLLLGYKDVGARHKARA
jgi:hypothetical protein